MEIIGYFISPIVGVITLIAVVVGYCIGKGEVRLIPLPKHKRRVSDEKRRANIIARNIEAYDGTAIGQREVR